jgi:8-oxo-dGTP pyrophosphatase MutT (NUDIX family)
VSFLDHLRACNRHDLAHFLPFRVDGSEVGWIAPSLAGRLAEFPDVFTVGGRGVDLAPGLPGFEARGRAVARVTRTLAADGLISNWRDEPFPVATGFTEPALFTIERAAVALFGIRAYGVHLNGYVRGPGGAMDLWIGRRAATAGLAPGKLDNMVAGGLPHGLGIEENLIKECAEEAAIPADMARRAEPVGEVSYTLETDGGLRRDTLFCFDLELPGDFRPRNTDGEVAAFMRWPVERVAALVDGGDDFKFNCNLVIIQFLLRHGFIGPEHEDYRTLREALR